MWPFEVTLEWRLIWRNVFLITFPCHSSEMGDCVPGSPGHDCCWCNNWLFIIWRHLTCLTPPCFCLHWCIASSQVASGYLVTLVHISPGAGVQCSVSPDCDCRWHPACSRLDTSPEWVTVICNLILRWKAKVVWKTNFSWTSNASLIL